MITNSDACLELAKMADTSNYSLKSDRKVRHGYMGFVVKLSNLIKRRAEVDHLIEIIPD